MLLLVVVIVSCNNNTVKDERDSPKQGTIHISVDETFKPVIEEQIKVYESTFPNAHIIASYKSEADCFRDLQKDSKRLIIVARGLNEQEQTFYEQKLQFRAQFDLIAYDAVAVIINVAADDSVFTIKKLENILSGKINMEAVMDGKNATSTVRYLKDSILKNKPFGANVVAAKNSEDVVKVVSEKKNAIGFVGLNWIGDNYDEKQ
ncbi:MAG: substrate-binding domain-containing protein, partial [Chitinophagaceae bacterium]